MPIQLLVQDFSVYGESEAARNVGVFATRAEALAAAQVRVDTCLEEFFVAGIRADALFRQWSLFGEDVWLVPDDGTPSFSAVEYARARCRVLAA